MSTGFTGAPPPARFNMARYCLEGAAEAKPHDHGLVVLSKTEGRPVIEFWPYAALDEKVRRFGAALLAYGIRPGERVLIRLSNTTDYAFLFFGAIAAGIVPIPTSNMLTERESEIIAVDADIAAVALDPTTATGSLPEGAKTLTPEQIARMHLDFPPIEYADTGADDPAFLIYTSGTTGRPKGVLHGHRSAWGRRPMYRDWYGITPDDRVLHAGAFNWTYTLGTGLTDPWANHATAIINTLKREPAEWLELIRAHDATIFAAVPSLYRQILKYAPPGPIDVGQLRHGLTAGETLPASVAAEWQGRTGTRLCEALGMSEISTYISASPTAPAKPGTVGKSQQGRCIAILSTEGGTAPLPPGETGLLAVHRTDPALMLDYWNRPGESDQVFRGDWFVGGDLASMDEDGFVTHEGRGDDLMNAFGYRVSPMEVEQSLATCPGVSEIAVTEINVRDGVSIIAAFIVAVDEHDNDLTARLNDLAARQLASYKRPKDILFTDTLPRTPNGKIKRASLQQIYDAQKATS